MILDNSIEVFDDVAVVKILDEVDFLLDSLDFLFADWHFLHCYEHAVV
jgi:hypothetical protein